VSFGPLCLYLKGKAVKRSLLVFSMILVLMLGAAGTASAAKPVPASGSFVAIIDPGSITLTPVGNNCQLQVEGQIIFSGDLAGTGDALTTALVLAPCSVVAVSPPGSLPDVFSSDIEFEGMLGDAEVTAGIHYHGRAFEGGAIQAMMNFSGDLRGSVKVDGQAAVGGDYSGKIVLK
jgi:hypothetical protein